jgi:thiol-disulfide isomerase/thioredoxin
MRWLALLPCAVLGSVACVSRPLDVPPEEGETSVPTAPSVPSAVSEGDFRPHALYPAGPYGSEVGSIIADHAFLGWRDPVGVGFDPTRLEEIRLSDFHDPRGQNTELIVLNSSAVWCPACRSEMQTLDRLDMSGNYRRSKVVIVGTLFEDAVGAPAKPQDLALWGKGLTFLIDFPLVLDPGLKLGPYFSQSVTPLNLIIDARTMEILRVYMGYSATFWSYVDAELEARGITPPVR